MRTADHWKLIGYRLSGTGTDFVDRIQLYDLARDPFEIDDLSAVAAHQDKLAELKAILARERIDNDDPLSK